MSILNLTFDISNFNQSNLYNVEKKIAVKRTPDEMEKFEKKTYNKYAISVYSKQFEIKAILRNEKYSTYISDDDWFYKVLLNSYEIYKSTYQSDNYIHKSPFDELGFKFKTSSKLQCSNLGKTCEISDLFNRTCKFTVRLIPYTIDTQEKTLVGFKIHVTKIHI